MITLKRSPGENVIVVSSERTLFHQDAADFVSHLRTNVEKEYIELS